MSDKNNRDDKKGSDKHNSLPNIPSSEYTSRTISSNHTFKGQLNKDDLTDKGHNFDVTDVEMGKLELHKLYPPDQIENPSQNFSNIDNETLTELKLNRDKNLFFEQFLRPKLKFINVFKKFVNSNKDELKIPESTKNSIASSNFDEIVSLQMKKGKKWGDLFKIFLSLSVLGSIILGILYGLNKWDEYKDNISRENNVQDNSSKNMDIQNTIYTYTNEDQVTQSVNYQSIGRGLIYGCKNSTWACVDKTNYIMCRKLFKNNNQECYTKGVLKTNEACFNFKDQFTKNGIRPDFCK